MCCCTEAPWRNKLIVCVHPPVCFSLHWSARPWHSWERSLMLSRSPQFHSNRQLTHFLSTPVLNEVRQLVEQRPCDGFIAQARLYCSSGLKNYTGERQEGPKWTTASPQWEPNTSIGKVQQPRPSSPYYPFRTELCHNSFTTPNPNLTLCFKKQQRTTQEANVTSQNSSIPIQTSSIALQLPASVQTVCKACHASKQSAPQARTLHSI